MDADKSGFGLRQAIADRASRMNDRKLLTGVTCHLHERNTDRVKNRNDRQRARRGQHVKWVRLTLDTNTHHQIALATEQRIRPLGNANQESALGFDGWQHLDNLIRVPALGYCDHHIARLHHPEAAMNSVSRGKK